MLKTPTISDTVDTLETSMHSSPTLRDRVMTQVGFPIRKHGIRFWDYDKYGQPDEQDFIEAIEAEINSMSNMELLDTISDVSGG